MKFFEAASILLFMGSLIHNTALHQSGDAAVRELIDRGYSISTEEPIRIYPAETGGDMSGAHAGGWRPGIISLREKPQGQFGPEIFIRHELMHEASHKTCGGKMALWAEEAAAISFSGELAQAMQSLSELPDDAAISRLKYRLSRGAHLDAASYITLERLIVAYGWPTTPCAVSREISERLTPLTPSEKSGISGILIHLASGRILESKGDLKTPYPPGSLLKIPYAAALQGDFPPSALANELARSDTVALLRHREHLDVDRYRFLLSPVDNNPLADSLVRDDLGKQPEQFWRRLLGERDNDGPFPFEAALPDLALVLRASLLYQPETFVGLSRNGLMEGSTLLHQAEDDRKLLAKLHAVAKTGTVADIRNTPLVGHLMIAWPAVRPVYLAVFRSTGIRGAAVLGRAAPILKEWSDTHPLQYAGVRVQLLSSLGRKSWEIVDESPTFVRRNRDGTSARVSLDGRFRINSSARKSRSERMVNGLLQIFSDSGKVVLETDMASYVEAVLSAEGEDLPLEAGKAVAAVVAFNGVHGNHRHPETHSLCDLTHCMVFLGAPEKPNGSKTPILDMALVTALEKQATTSKTKWLPFSKGGNEQWSKTITAVELKKILGENGILDIRRERTRTGEVVVHLVYPENEERVPCEVFRNKLKLLSCPGQIITVKNGESWDLHGLGQGHGEGLSFERARALAEAGSSAAAILDDAYGR